MHLGHVELPRRRRRRLLPLTAVGLLAGACVVHVETGQTPPASPAPAHAAAPHAPTHPPQAAAPTPAPSHSAPPAAPTRHVALHFAGRIVHPPPAQNASAGTLDIRGLNLRLRPNRTCGPRESAPGHWIHVDCNRYKPVTSAKPFSPRKLRFMLSGAAKLDAPIQLADGVDHRNDGTEGPVKDQGQVGSCTAFSLSSAMDNAIRRQNKADTTSSLHLWSHYGLPYMESAGDKNLNKPIATWDAWPYDQRTACEMDQSVDQVGNSDADCGPYSPAVVPGTASRDAQVQAKVRDADSKGRWKVTGYDQLDSNPDVFAQYLATGADIWCAMTIGKTWFYLKGDTIPDWLDSQDEGGHVVLIAGFRHKDGKRQFLVHNSWGADWGDNGYAWVSENALSHSLIEAYKVTVADASPPPSPSPQPMAAPSSAPATPVAPPADDPNALTDDDCSENQLVDAITGQCAEMCSDDTRPANGKCAGTVSSTSLPVPAGASPKVQSHH